MSPTEKLILIQHLAEDAIHNPEPRKALASIAGIALIPASPAMVSPSLADNFAPRLPGRCRPGSRGHVSWWGRMKII